MAILIKDPETDRVIRELAQRTGETITEAVKKAAEQRIARLPPSDLEVARRGERLARILARFDSLPTVDARSVDEVLCYGGSGLFD